MALLKRAGAAVLVACLATGCAHAPGANDAASRGPSSMQVEATSTPTPPPISLISFGAMEWSDGLTGKRFRMKDGTATVDSATYSIEGTLSYGDANGDGETDAVVVLKKDSGDKKPTTSPYIWLWDAKTRTVRQIVDPVNLYSTCGHVLKGIAKDPLQGFVFHDMLKDEVDVGCEAKHEMKRTVTVGDGDRLIATKPFFGYGGICNQAFPKPEVRSKPYTIRIAPQANSATIISTGNLFFETPGSQRKPSPKGWAQVQWVTPEVQASGQFWGTCGYVKVD